MLVCFVSFLLFDFVDCLWDVVFDLLVDCMFVRQLIGYCLV